MTSTESKEPKGSDDSSTDFTRCRCGHFQINHRPYTEGGCRNCGCDGFKLPAERQEQQRGPDGECLHSNRQYTGSVYDGPGGRKTWLYYSCPDCKSSWKEEEAKCPPACAEAHTYSGSCVFRADGPCDCSSAGAERHADYCRTQRDSCPHCGSEDHKWADCKPYEQAVRADAAPLTPEEECSHIGSRDIGGSDVPGARWTRFHCDNCGKEWVRNWETEKAVQDPPLTPEEEEILPPPEGPEHRCNACGHTEGEGCGCSAHAFVSREHCDRCEGTWLIKNVKLEEEEEACETCTEMLAGWCRDCGRRMPDDKEPACLHLLTDHEGECPCPPQCGCCMTKEPKPPQPERRPPLAYAYSVQGHLYEVALPGDATVVAQDGALIITHSLGPIAGIVQARPLEGEQS